MANRVQAKNVITCIIMVLVMYRYVSVVNRRLIQPFYSRGENLLRTRYHLPHICLKTPRHSFSHLRTGEQDLLPQYFYSLAVPDLGPLREGPRYSLLLPPSWRRTQTTQRPGLADLNCDIGGGHDNWFNHSPTSGQPSTKDMFHYLKNNYVFCFLRRISGHSIPGGSAK